MKQIIAVGIQSLPQHITALVQMRGYSLTLIADEEALQNYLQATLQPEHAVVLLAVRSVDAHWHEVAQLLQQSAIPWLAMAAVDDSRLMQDIYRSGAAAVVPSNVESTLLCDLVQRIMMQSESSQQESSSLSKLRRYRIRERIHVEADQLLHIQQGTVSLTVSDADGDERVLGFASCGEIVSGLGESGLNLVVVAHSDVQARLVHWSEVKQDEACMSALHRRLQVMQDWCLALTEPSVDRRVLQSLRSLGRQAGVVEQHKAMLDFHITHAELAAAIRATRSTVTRSIGRLRQQGHISIERGPSGSDCFHLELPKHFV